MAIACCSPEGAGHLPDGIEPRAPQPQAAGGGRPEPSREDWVPAQAQAQVHRLHSSWAPGHPPHLQGVGLGQLSSARLCPQLAAVLLSGGCPPPPPWAA